uniref:Uncharacterized protein n=1 Tax=Leersia perrieri TaxID=77586 RepID=A0A0D9XWZ5_9ORYZ
MCVQNSRCDDQPCYIRIRENGGIVPPKKQRSPKSPATCEGTCTRKKYRKRKGWQAGYHDENLKLLIDFVRTVC